MNYHDFVTFLLTVAVSITKLISGQVIHLGTYEVIVDPVSINTTDGTTVEFNCTANNNPSTLRFLVNGTRVSTDVEEKGFMEQTTEILGGGMKRRRLLVTTSIAYNNSRISCQAFGSSMNVESNNATVLVQGSLSPVVNLSYSFIDSCTVNISWIPPFTLLGTDITGYNISATNNGTTTNYFTSDSYYVLLLSVFIVNVSAYNGLEGESANIYVPSIEPTVLLSIKIVMDLFVSVSINANDVCLNNYSITVEISLLRGNALVDFKLVNLNSAVEEISRIMQLEEHQNYTIEIFFFDVFGKKVANKTTFNTYDIKAIKINQVADGIVTITCQFNSFSNATACTVELVENNVEQYTATFNRSGDFAAGNISIMSGGVYDILAFDEDSTVVAASLLGVSITGLRPTTTTITSTSTSTSTTPTSFFSPSTAIPSTSTIISPTSNSKKTEYILIGVGLGLLVVITSTIVLVVLLALILRKKRSGRTRYQVEQDQFMSNISEEANGNDKCEVVNQEEVDGNDKHQRSSIEIGNMKLPAGQQDSSSTYTSIFGSDEPLIKEDHKADPTITEEAQLVYAVDSTETADSNSIVFLDSGLVVSQESKSEETLVITINPPNDSFTDASSENKVQYADLSSCSNRPETYQPQQQQVSYGRVDHQRTASQQISCATTKNVPDLIPLSLPPPPPPIPSKIRLPPH